MFQCAYSYRLGLLWMIVLLPCTVLFFTAKCISWIKQKYKLRDAKCELICYKKRM